MISDVLTHKYFWGTRQQLLCGKVIADWVDTDRNTALDPIFGALLCPCGGKEVYNHVNVFNPEQGQINHCSIFASYITR